MSFREDILATFKIANCFKDGLNSIDGVYKSYFKCKDTRKIEGSIDIDKCLKQDYPSSNRWDYLIGYKGHYYFVEVHGGSTSDISVVIAKKSWLISWLREQSSPILKREYSFHWVTTKHVTIRKGSPQQRKLNASGIKGPKRICQCDMK